MSIVEKMAKAIYEAGGFEYVSRKVFPGGGTPYGQWAVAVEQARAALTATGLTEAQLEGLANGTMVVVPVEPTMKMLNAAIDIDSFKLGDISPLGFRISPQKMFERCYRAMLAAKEG